MAMGILTLAPATMVASNSNNVVNDCPKGAKKVDPKTFTDKLVKDLNLTESQAKDLLELNTKYADLLASPHGNIHCKKAEGQCKMAEGHCKKVDGGCKKAEGQCKRSDAQCKKMEGECKKVEGQCKKAEGCYKKSEGQCKKAEAKQCDKQSKGECKKSEAKQCDKQGKENCKGEGAKCDKQKMAMHSEHAKEIMAKHSAYLEGLKKILTDSQYQQLLNM